MTSYPVVFRIESGVETAIPFPSLQDAMREAPSHPEARIATSEKGVLLAESVPDQDGLIWRPTVAGLDVLSGDVFGMVRRAS